VVGTPCRRSSPELPPPHRGADHAHMRTACTEARTPGDPPASSLAEPLVGSQRSARSCSRCARSDGRRLNGGTGRDRGEADNVAVPEGWDSHAADGTRRWRATLPGVPFGVHRPRGHASRTWRTTPEVVAGGHERADEPAGDVRGPAASATLSPAGSGLTAGRVDRPGSAVRPPRPRPARSSRTCSRGRTDRRRPGPLDHLGVTRCHRAPAGSPGALDRLRQRGVSRRRRMVGAPLNTP
jgi:hypothetical protein